MVGEPGHGRGCIDCVRLVRQEEIQRDRERERTIEKRNVDEVQKNRETTII